MNSFELRAKANRLDKFHITLLISSAMYCLYLMMSAPIKTLPPCYKFQLPVLGFAVIVLLISSSYVTHLKAKAEIQFGSDEEEY